MVTCDIAKELGKILREELYLAKASEFDEYVTDVLGMDIRSARRIIKVHQTVHLLQQRGLALPANETQAAELSRLDPELQPRIWNELLIRFEREEKTLTTGDVRRAVEIAESQIPQIPQKLPESSRGAVEVAMEDQDNGSEAPKVPPPKKGAIQEAVLVLTEKGEAALNRIRKVCGKEVGDAIANGTKAMTERDIRNWADYDNDMMRQLLYFVFDLGYPVTRAINFLTREITDSTDVGDLILIASSRGGSAMVNFEGRAKIVVELTRK
jgi:hypothetical protein